jgi:hypothetical protein
LNNLLVKSLKLIRQVYILNRKTRGARALEQIGLLQSVEIFVKENPFSPIHPFCHDEKCPQETMEYNSPSSFVYANPMTDCRKCPLFEDDEKLKKEWENTLSSYMTYETDSSIMLFWQHFQVGKGASLARRKYGFYDKIQMAKDKKTSKNSARKYIVNIGFDVQGSRKANELAEKHKRSLRNRRNSSPQR